MAIGRYSAEILEEDPFPEEKTFSTKIQNSRGNKSSSDIIGSSN